MCRSSIQSFVTIDAPATAHPKTQNKGGVMTQYLVAIHHPDDYDPSTEDEAMARDIDMLNDEMAAAGVMIFVGASSRPTARRRCGRNPMVRVLVTDGRTLRPGSTSTVFGCCELPTWTRPCCGGARLQSLVERRSRCARLGSRPDSRHQDAARKALPLDRRPARESCVRSSPTRRGFKRHRTARRRPSLSQ